jgi:predicted nucleotidyltransferase component of viral defense system
VIPRAHLTAWRTTSPWPDDTQVEQDLVVSRAIVDMFTSADLARAMAFRGGTALHKLFFDRPGRYSEDIDLVQLEPGRIGPALGWIRDGLDRWLGEPRYTRGHGRVTLVYRFETTSRPVRRMRLKIEINTREHFAVLGCQKRVFAVESPWFNGRADITTYRIEELLATKLRALYQRKKGRDLYDLWISLKSLVVDDEKVVECFGSYLDHGGISVSRAEYEANLMDKLRSRAFLQDVAPLLPTGADYDVEAAAQLVRVRLIEKLPGKPWRGEASQGPPD